MQCGSGFSMHTCPCSTAGSKTLLSSACMPSHPIWTTVLTVLLTALAYRGPGLGGYSKPDPRRPTDASDAASWTPGFEAFTAYAARVASLLSPSCSAANKGAAAVPPLMGGPGW